MQIHTKDARFQQVHAQVMRGMYWTYRVWSAYIPRKLVMLIDVIWLLARFLEARGQRHEYANSEVEVVDHLGYVQV